MDLVQAVLLGLLQGVAEWLPISSQGQVMAAALNIFSISAEEAFKYAIFLHAGTLTAAAVYFRKELASILKPENRKLLEFVLLGLVGSAITVLPGYFLLKSMLNSPFPIMVLIAIALIFTGAIQFRGKAGKRTGEKKSGFIVGLAQGFSVIPGISRSGVTSSALLLQGFSPEEAFRLSFILSIPSVLLAEIAFGLFEKVSLQPIALVAIAIAGLAGYASIDVLLRTVRKVEFGWFCIGFGLLYLALAFV